ncbi:MAG: glycerophosphodiester phosphodiesterase family protein [Chitinophagaceae bacterium]|nr:MAG: glycerophosphodiester phosphodiesterase family protein [Chitinophagaceae bacterium]
MTNYPENTLPALQHAINVGAQMIEFDVQLSADSVMVIMHDNTVDRTTNGTGEVSALTFAQLRALDAGSRKSASFTGTRIPTFEEVLDIMPANIWLNCHLKGGAPVGRAAALLVHKKGRKAQAFLACGEEAGAAARAVVPDILICNAETKYRTNDAMYVQATIDMHASFIQLVVTKDSGARKPLVEQLKRNDVKVNFFMAKETSELPYLYDLGIDFVLVNDMDLFIPVAARLGIKPVKPIYK